MGSYFFQKMLITRMLLFSCLVQAAVPSYASQDMFDLSFEELMAIEVEIATGRPQPLVTAPAVATVITADDIKAMGATNLDEALESVPGLHVMRWAFFYKPLYTIRGIFSPFNQQVLLMMNGVPVTSAYTGDRGNIWTGMPVQGIARIEVIRGPGSALYGADAFAGVINVITKDRRDIDGTEVGVRGGSFETADAWLLHGSEWNGFDLAFTLEYGETDGQREIIEADAQTQLDGLFGTAASLAPGPLNLQRRNLDARLDISKGPWRFRGGFQGRDDVGNGAGLSQALDPHNRYRSERINADLTYDNPTFTADWGLEAQLSYYHFSQETERDVMVFPPGAFGGAFPEGVFANPETFEQFVRLGVTGSYQGFSGHRIRLGGGINYEDLYKVKDDNRNFVFDPDTGVIVPLGGFADFTDTPGAFTPEKDRLNTYLLVQDEWRLAPSFDLTAGVRYDHYSDFGGTVNPRMALVWRARDDLTAKFLYGRAFRAPSFTELFTVNNPTGLGNPDLDPETINTVEVAFGYTPTSRLSLNLGAYAYRWEDVIRYPRDPAPATTVTAQNSGEQTGRGLELDFRWQATDELRLLGNYAYQRSIDEESGQDAGYTPRHQAYLRADWNFRPDWSLTPQVSWIGERRREPADSRPDLGGYALVDLTLRRHAGNSGWEFAASVRNLLDEDAREPSEGPGAASSVSIPNDLPLPGRSGYLEARFLF